MWTFWIAAPFSAPSSLTLPKPRVFSCHAVFLLAGSMCRLPGIGALFWDNKACQNSNEVQRFCRNAFSVSWVFNSVHLENIYSAEGHQSNSANIQVFSCSSAFKEYLNHLQCMCSAFLLTLLFDGLLLKVAIFSCQPKIDSPSMFSLLHRVW